MAMQQLSLPGEVVKKHNRLVRAKLHIDNAQASRILASLIACIRADDTDFAETYSLQIKNFMADDSGRTYRNIKSTCHELLYAYAEIEEDDIKGEKQLSLIPFFREIRYKRGIVNVQFNQNMRKLLLQLRSFFTEYNLLEYLNLPSIYSQRIFEVLKSWSDKPEVIIAVHDLHHMLDTPPSFQSNFKEFRRRVLEKSHKDITEKTSFQYEWEPVKVGRSVERIRFIFSGGRRALAEKVKEEAKKEKQARLNNDRFRRAWTCAMGKKGECRTQDNRPILCKLCLRLDFCASARKEAQKAQV